MTAVTVTDRSALASALRDLKLSGMLATLDARLAQAGAGELGHLDFLQVLCQDEISRRQSMSLARRNPPGQVRDRGHPRRVRLRRLPEAAGRPDPRSRRPPLARRRGVGHPLRARRGRQEPHRPGPRPPRHPGRGRGPVHQDQPGPRPPRRREGRPHLGQAARRAHPPRRPRPGRLRHARAHRTPGRRPLRAHHRTSRQVPDPDIQPGARRLVSAVPQPGRRRVAPGPAHQQQSPGLHERAQLPAEQGTRACHPHGEHERQVK